MKRVILFFAALASSLLAHAQHTEPTNLATDEIISLVKGKDLATQNVRWGNVRLQFKENGSLYGNASAGSDSGKWRVEDGKLCLEWRRWDYEGCGNVLKAGGEFQHLWPNGQLHFTYRP